MPDEGGFDNPQTQDSKITPEAISWVKDARNRYSKDEKKYPSRETRSSNGEMVDFVFGELKDLDDPSKAEDVKNPSFQRDYADALALLGWESVMKDRVENLEPEVAAEATRVGQQSDKLFLAACRKLFPNLREQISMRSARENLRNVSSLLTSDEVADIGASAESDSKIVNELDREKQRVGFSMLADSLADRMRDAISGTSQDTFPKLTAVPEPQRDTMVNAAKAMYTLKLATPKA